MNILSIQSWVAYGHVGNASAVFPLQRLGAEVWAINTVQFSNHTGYGAWTGTVATGPQIADLVDGIAARGALQRCDAVLSGYVGDAGIGAAILGAVGRVRGENPESVYCCDPVIGDLDTGSYVRPGVAEFLRDRAIPVAGIATPNRFELEYLTGIACTTLAGAKRAVAALQARGPRTVLVTSLQTEATPAESLDMLAADGAHCHLLRTPAPGHLGQRRGRCRRRPVPVPRAAQRQRRRGAGGGGQRRVRPAGAHRRGRLARDPDRRGTAGVRQPVALVPTGAVLTKAGFTLP